MPETARLSVGSAAYGTHMHVRRLPSELIPSARLTSEGASCHAPQCSSRNFPESLAESTSDAPTLVPWRVLRSDNGELLTVINISAERLTFVRFAAAGFREHAVSLPWHVGSQEGVELSLSHLPESTPSALLILRWFRPGGQELLWPVGV